MSPVLLLRLAEHYWDEYPLEAVGVVFDDGTPFRLRNWALSPGRFFTFGFEILFHHGWRAWRHGEGISLIYHSHGENTRPSETDQSFMKALSVRWPHVKHLIYTPDGSYSVWQYVG